MVLGGTLDPLDLWAAQEHGCIQELYIFRFGDPVFSIGRINGFKTPPINFIAAPSCKWDSIAGDFVKVESVPRSTTNVFLLYDTTDTHSTVFDKLVEVLKGVDVLFVSGTVEPGKVLVFVRKLKQCTPTFTIGDVNPQMFLFKVGSGKASETLFGKFTKVFTGYTSNIIVRMPATCGSYSFDQIIDELRGLTVEQLNRFRGMVECKEPKQRTAFETAFMRCFTSLMKTRDSRGMRCEIINAYKYKKSQPSLLICPLQLLQGFEQQGVRLKEVSLANQLYTFRQLLADPDILQRYSVIVLGDDKTTGWGKTNSMLRVLCEHVMAHCESRGLPEDEANIIITNTVETLTTVDLAAAKVKAWLCDEMCPGDKDSQIYMSNNILKCMLTVTMNADIRAREKNIRIPAGLVRIFTSNARDNNEWVGRHLSFSEPMRRKSITFNISGGTPLVSPDWWTHSLGVQEAARCRAGRVSRHGAMSDVLEARAALIPESPSRPPRQEYSFLTWALCPHRLPE
jgi:hypothetical protein